MPQKDPSVFGRIEIKKGVEGAGIYMSDGSSIVDKDGNIDAPVTSTNLTLSGTLAVTGTSALAGVTATSMISATPTGAGIGYGTGAGATVTQTTNRTTGVTINTLTGEIVTDNTSLAAEGSADFIVTNSTVAISDVIVLSIQSGENSGGTVLSVQDVAAGSFTIRVHNGNVAAGTAETGAIKINFAVIKAVAA